VRGKAATLAIAWCSRCMGAWWSSKPTHFHSCLMV
jgi:hypothetical protein